MFQNLRNRRHAIAVGFVILAAQLFLFPLRAAAIPISEYQQNLNKSYSALEALYEMDEEDSEYSVKFKETIDSLSASLPAEIQVEAGGEVYTVNNAALHEDLDELPQSEDQTESIRLLMEKIHALRERVNERLSANTSQENKGWAKSRMEGILARPEYVSGERGPNALTALIQSILRWIESLFPKRQAMDASRALSISQVVQVVIVALAGLLLIYVLSIFLRRFKRSKKYKQPKKREARIVLGERLDPDETSTNLLAEAEALAKRGELRAAIRKGYIALLVELGDRKIISLAQHKTNRDYLRGLRDTPQLHSEMRGLTDSFERHWYGFVEANENDWQQFRTGYLTALQTGK